MPLPLPKLDNRSFEQLIAEGRAMLPRLAPDWTDHNYHDPGITLIDLFAWLYEMDIYRLDQLSDASRRAFLRLVEGEPLPAQAAETVLTLTQVAPGAAATPLPAGLQVGAAQGPAVFETTAEVNVSPAGIIRVRGRQKGQWVDLTAAAGSPGEKFAPFGAAPEPGDALALDFNRPFVDQAVTISLYFWADPELDRITRQRLVAEWQEAWEEAQADCPPGQEPNLPDWRLHYSARTQWEYRSAGSNWRPLAEVVDETRGLSLSGFVRFQAPLDQAPDESGRFTIRCRLVSGGYECPPWVDLVEVNAVPAAHAARIAGVETLGRSSGRPGMFFPLRELPVLPGSLDLKVIVDGSPEDWQEGSDWDQAGSQRRQFVLDAARGEVSFGDGRHGRIPPAGADIQASYRVGGGPGGNLPARQLSVLLDNAQNAALVPGWGALCPLLAVSQPYPALGGAEAETLDTAQGRALDALARRTRGVTLADFEALAAEVPGVPVARARALPNYFPGLPCFPADGCVTVVVVPDCPGPRPEPGPDFLEAVARYLNRRRILTAEMHVIGPCYIPISVHATLHLQPGWKAGEVRARAMRALEDFFHPLTGGPYGEGWPVGRDVYRVEVMGLLGALPGVLTMEDLGLQSQADEEPRCQNYPICPDCLVVSGEHDLRIIERSMQR